MEKRLRYLREERIPFGFVYTLTRDNLSELEWAADFAVAQGAASLQVHPIEEYGRARLDASLESLPDLEMATACLVVDCLRSIHEGKLVLQFDALHRESLPVEPDDVARWKSGLDRGHRNLGEVVSPLVIEEDGTVSPLRYGFPRSFSLGNLYRGNLYAMAGEWTHRRSGAFCDLYRDVLLQVRKSRDRFCNMYGKLAEEAEARRPRTLVAIG
jgi:MoaA/NifB/PqqE/SkfB family radical SAM enzyme